jgi:hypothetical protein
MLGLIVFAAIVVLMVAALGLPYGQSWANRWGGGR